jgi:hypothetical protein
LGPFAFLGKDFQTISLDRAIFPSEQFSRKHVVRTIWLAGAQDGKANRTSHQVRQLQPLRIRLLVANHNVELIGDTAPIVAVADAPELQFEILIFLGAASLAYDVRDVTMLPVEPQEVAHTLKPEPDSDVAIDVKLWSPLSSTKTM